MITITYTQPRASLVHVCTFRTMRFAKKWMQVLMDRGIKFRVQIT